MWCNVDLWFFREKSDACKYYFVFVNGLLCLTSEVYLQYKSLLYSNNMHNYSGLNSYFCQMKIFYYPGKEGYIKGISHGTFVLKVIFEALQYFLEYIPCP